MRTKENRIRRAFFVSGLCLALILFAAPAAQAEADPAGVTADRNGIPVVRLTIDPEELQKVNESPDHSYRAREGRVRIEIPQGYEGEFGEIDPETLKADLPLNYIRGRGNSTWLAEKKSYKFKLENKTDILGMGKSKHWVLLSNAMDSSLLRNRVMAWIGRAFSVSFTPKMLSVDLYINDEYMGNYVLGHQVRIEKASVGIDEVPAGSTKEPEITGGYLLAMNPGSREAPEDIFVTDRGVRFLLKTPGFSPDEEEAGTQEQRDYITGYLQSTEDIIFSEGLQDADGRSWTEYMDMASTAKYWWIQEICGNGDAYRSDSAFLYKERHGKLTWGPLWDFDITLNPVMYDDGLNNITMTWVDHLRACDPQFREELVRTWNELEPILEEAAGDGGLIDRYAGEIIASWQQNHDRWYPDIDPESNGLDTQVIELKQFIRQRIRKISAALEVLGDVTEQASAAQDASQDDAAGAQAVPGAQPDDVAGGICGTCWWRIDADRNLVIGPLDGGEGTLDAWTNEAQRPWHPYRDSIRSAAFRGTVHARTCLAFFYHCYSLERIDLTGLDTSGVSMMRGMFSWCPALKELDVSALDTSSAVNMREMFLGDYKLTRLDLSALDLSGVSDMRCMFYRCHALSDIVFPKDCGSAATDMTGMFADCLALESLDVSGFNTANVTHMRALFYRCNALRELSLAGMDTSSVTSMAYMFAGCGNLTALDLKDLDTSGVTDMSCMFLACGDLASLDLSSFDTAQAEMDHMFANCSSLCSVTVGSLWKTESGRGEDTMFHGCRQPAEIITGAEE